MLGRLSDIGYVFDVMSHEGSLVKSVKVFERNGGSEGKDGYQVLSRQ